MNTHTHTFHSSMSIEEKKGAAIVFDFDLTISTGHLYYQVNGGGRDQSKLDLQRYPSIKREDILQNPAYIRDVIFGGEERIAMLDKKFMGFRLFSKASLIISSDGFKEQIKQALRSVDLLRHFELIHARDAQYKGVVEDLTTGEEYFQQGRKDTFILMRIAPSYQCVVFIDDTMKQEYWEAMRPLQDTITLLTIAPYQQGMIVDDFEKIKKALKSCKTEKKIYPIMCPICNASQAYSYTKEYDIIFCSKACLAEVVDKK